MPIAQSCQKRKSRRAGEPCSAWGKVGRDQRRGLVPASWSAAAGSLAADEILFNADLQVAQIRSSVRCERVARRTDLAESSEIPSFIAGRGV